MFILLVLTYAQNAIQTLMTKCWSEVRLKTLHPVLEHARALDEGLRSLSAQ